jgi:4-methyl-5(b-hydroxyethyl)-thiazole monophosphate biosynthesis
MNEEKVLVPLAPGFEETEAIAIIDVLRRAELEVSSVSLGSRQVEGAHGITLVADLVWEELDVTSVTAVVLPGGMPGTTNLAADERLLSLVRRLAAEGRTTAALCAAPLVLAAAGVLDGEVPFTCHPSTRGVLATHGPLHGPRVIRSGPVITSQGPGTALEFALEVVSGLCGVERAEALAGAMLVPFSRS